MARANRFHEAKLFFHQFHCDLQKSNLALLANDACSECYCCTVSTITVPTVRRDCQRWYFIADYNRLSGNLLFRVCMVRDIMRAGGNASPAYELKSIVAAMTVHVTSLTAVQIAIWSVIDYRLYRSVHQIEINFLSWTPVLSSFNVFSEPLLQISFHRGELFNKNCWINIFNILQVNAVIRTWSQTINWNFLAPSQKNVISISFSNGHNFVSIWQQ